MRHLFSALFSMFICSSLFSQMTGLQWQRSLGGTNSDVASLSFLASDGGIIIIGSTLSNTGVVNSNHGGEDVWVMKLTKNGSLEWSKCFGGSGTDEPMAAAYKSGILTIAANSNSINGNVTNNHGSTDIWVFQLDALGNIVWQNSFGGSGDDKCNSIISVSFGGFAVSGYTNSSDGDVTTYHGGLDLWVLYISDAGSLQWQKALGGNSGEVSWHSKIIESNGSFLVGTETFSNNGDVSGLVRYSDIWLVKLNTAGILQWQKCLGGNGFDYFTDIGEGQNGELYILGKTDSYDLPSAHGINNDYNDIYLCRLSSSGSIVQQKCFGSMGEDSPVQMALTADGVLFSANVYQQSGDVTGLHGGYDIWMVKVKPDFTIEWQKALGDPEWMALNQEMLITKRPPADLFKQAMEIF